MLNEETASPASPISDDNLREDQNSFTKEQEYDRAEFLVRITELNTHRKFRRHSNSPTTILSSCHFLSESQPMEVNKAT